MSKRKYDFKLPYHLSAVKVFYAEGELKREGLWEHLPKNLQDAMEHAKSKWYPLTITEQELDELDDGTWSKIAAKLQLKWENEK